MRDTDALVEQQAYYDARAPEYDDWWLRRGRYDLGDEQRALWRAEITHLRTWLRGLAPLGRVLELAAGTGNWTAELAGVSDTVLAIDGSDQVLEINRRKIGPDVAVDFVKTDVFAFQPVERFDTVFFSFWLSHVPVDRRRDHWALVRGALDEGGRVVMIDNAHPDRVSTARFGRVHQAGEEGKERRRLADGRHYDIVKHYWHAEELVADARSYGVDLVAAETDHYFLYAHGRVVEEEST